MFTYETTKSITRYGHQRHVVSIEHIYVPHSLRLIDYFVQTIYGYGHLTMGLFKPISLC